VPPEGGLKQPTSLPVEVLRWLAERSRTCAHPAVVVRRHPAAAAGGPAGRPECGGAGRAVLPTRRPDGRDLQDRGRRQPGPAAGRAGRAGAVPARRGVTALVEQAIGHLANAWTLRRWRRARPGGRLTAIDQGLTTADRQGQAWRSMEHRAKLARRWRPGAATLCTTTPGDSLARTLGRKLRFASRAELTQERRRPARPGDAPGRLDSPGRRGLGRRSATGYRDS
jgi:hypothetical protein